MLFFIAIDNIQTSSTPTFHCNPAVLKQTHLALYLQTLISVTPTPSALQGPESVTAHAQVWPPCYSAAI